MLYAFVFLCLPALFRPVQATSDEFSKTFHIALLIEENVHGCIRFMVFRVLDVEAMCLVDES